MTTILPRRGTAAQWTAANPVLAMGELGFETDTTRWKRGDGTTAWTALDYGGSWDSIADRPIIIAKVYTSATSAQNSAAINTAISTAATNSGSVHIPSGTFNHEGFSAVDGMTIFGDGIGRTVLVNTHATNNSVNVVGAGGGEYVPGVCLYGMTLTTDAVRPDQIGVNILLCRTTEVSNIYITNHGVGVRHKSAWAQLYRSVRVENCTIGYHIPLPEPNVSSTPVTMIACHAISCGTGLQVDDGLECFLWAGGDLSRCDNGVVLNGNQTRGLKFDSVNFEQITNDDIIVGASGAPTAITFNGCRFFHDAGGGPRSVSYAAGSGVVFIGCRWTGYTLAIQQSSSTGVLMLLGCSQFNVTDFLDLNTVKYTISAIIVSQSGSVLRKEDLVTPSSVHTLSNKTLTSPRFANNGRIDDSNGNELIQFGVQSSAANYYRIQNGAAGIGPSIYVNGDDTNINSLMPVPKGTGRALLKDGADNSKTVAIDLSGISAATTRTLKAPDNSGTIALSASGTATLDFGSVGAQSFVDLTITVTGSTVGDSVVLGVPTEAITAGIMFTSWVSAANTVTVRAHNYGTTAADPASGTFKATIVR